MHKQDDSSRVDIRYHISEIFWYGRYHSRDMDSYYCHIWFLICLFLYTVVIMSSTYISLVTERFVIENILFTIFGCILLSYYFDYIYFYMKLFKHSLLFLEFISIYLLKSRLRSLNYRYGCVYEVISRNILFADK